MGCGACRDFKSVRVIKTAMPKTPTGDTEGAIIYPIGQTVPEIQGYTLDPENSQRLVPDEDVDCEKRITGILMQQDGTFIPQHVCRNSESEHKSKQVTLVDCKACPVRCLIKR